MTSARGWLNRLGTIGVIVVIAALGALVWWNIAGRSGYRETCRTNYSCWSFFCLRHRDGEAAGAAELATPGRCTKSCTTDADCGADTHCALLGPAARDDLPPFGKPTHACMVTQLVAPASPSRYDAP